ncbi:MAG: transposase [Sphaerobacter sp.]|nr:transposase [Sphaerobacter sp.]
MRVDGSGWYSWYYLPHWEQAGLVQFITFRLADALPREVVAELDDARRQGGSTTWRREWEPRLDAGYGTCVLRDPRVASLVQSALRYFDGSRYRLHAWVVMPNHVHALIEPFPGVRVSPIVQAWKSFTAREINLLLGRSDRLWQREYFDRAIRDAGHYERVVAYIHANPVKAGLVADPSAWPWSSAYGNAGIPADFRDTEP